MIQIKAINELNKIKIYQVNIDNKYDHYFIQDNESFYLAQLDSNYLINLNVPVSVSDEKILSVNPNKNKKKIKIINKKYFFSTNLANAKNKLNEINNLLKKILPNLSLDLDYLHRIKVPEQQIPILGTFNPENLVLCLYRGNTNLKSNDVCVGCIIIDINYKYSIKISSYTHIQYESLKYNKLLRAILILITPELRTCYRNNIREIISVAINPISAYLMICVFGAEPEKNFKKFINNNKINEISFEPIENYFANCKNSHGITSAIKINNDSIELADKLLVQVLEQIELVHKNNF